jgi:exodeoxyribonuclease V beta subunit
MSEAVVRYPRPAILERLDPSRHAVLEASAGTGKTYTLEHLVVELVLAHEVPIEQILVVTFTDKATREMRERVRNKLREIVAARPGELAIEGTSWTIDEAARRRLSDALAVFDRAPISTIHAFCQRVLTESAFDCARLLRQEQVESREVFGQAFREELRVQLAQGSALRPVLERALSAWSVDRLEASLFRWYVERGAPEPRFDPEKARDALERLPTRLELGPSGFARRALEQGLSRNPKREIPARLAELAPTVEAVRAGRPVYEALPAFWDWAQRDAPGRKTNLSYLRHYLRKADARALGPLADLVEQLGRAAGSPLTVLVAELLPRIVARLSGRKAQKGHFDFDDMLSMLREALVRDERGALVGELRRRYRVALVDEFQDTDQVQWDIFRRLFFEAEGEQRLFVIGDPKQAIYGFRNADVHTYHAARREIEASGGQVVPLTECFRSRGPLIDAFNRVLEDGFFTGVNAYPHPVTCGRPELRALGPGGADAVPVTLLHCVGRPKLTAGGVRRALGAQIAAEIRRLLDGGLEVDRGDGPKPLAPSDVHVLCRSRADAEQVGDALAAARIPHAFYKQEGLFQTEAARHVWELLRALEDPSSSVRRFHAWLSPFFAVPLERLADCRDVPPEHPLVARLSEWRALAEAQQWAALFRSILDDSGVVRRELFAAASERRLTDVQHILEILLEETHRGRRSLPQLVARLGAFIEGRELPVGESGNVHRLESEREAVQVLTMHKSKGLEAEVVFLAGGLSEPPGDTLAPSIFHDARGRRVAWIGEPTPEVRERMERERREEDERLLYVALTRARSKLYLPYFGPPPPGAEASAGEVSYELEPAPREPEPARASGAQLDLFFEEPELDAPDADGEPAAEDDEREYELRRMKGPYRVLNDRLRALVAAGATAGPDALFERCEVVVGPVHEGGVDPRVALAGWRPPPGLAAAEAIDGARYARLRRAHAGFDVTSYTRMKSARGGYRAPRPEAAEGAVEEALVAEAVDAALPVEAAELPGGSSMGVFLHEVLEHLPFESVRGLGDGAALLADEGLAAILARHARQNGIDEQWLPAAAALVVRALSVPLRLADGAALPQGLRTVERRVAELPFLHPIPERSHPTLADAPPGPDRPRIVIERGFIRGVIDLVFEHDGRYHVVDYKSDRLPSYAPERVADHVARNYLVQARLYTLGTLRALAIHDRDAYEERFGGLIYAFLRGMGEGGDGVWAARPSWEEVLGWERELLADAPWGHPLPPRRVRSGTRSARHVAAETG